MFEEMGMGYPPPLHPSGADSYRRQWWGKSINETLFFKTISIMRSDYKKNIVFYNLWIMELPHYSRPSKIL